MADPKPYDHTDPKQVKDAKKVVKILENRMRNGLLKIAGDHEIRYVIAQFLAMAKPYGDVFSTIPTQHAFNDGFRNAGNWWLSNLLLHDPQILHKLMNDQDSPMKVEKDDDGRTSTNNDTGTDEQ